MEPLPSTTQFIDNLISQLARCNRESQASPTNDTTDQSTHHRHTRHTHPTNLQSSSSFSSLPDAQFSILKPILLTLHCLFPNDLLPALDLLDRGLIRRFIHGAGDTSADDAEVLFNVKSTSASASSSRAKQRTYQVRLHAWHCTCPGFAVNAFRDPSNDDDDDFRGEVSGSGYCFGGTTSLVSGAAVPVCKHLIACLLMVRCPGLFDRRDGSERVVLGTEEFAAWCAG